MREPCSVDIWFAKVVQKSSRFQIEANKPHVFRIYYPNPEGTRGDKNTDISNEKIIQIFGANFHRCFVRITIPIPHEFTS